MILDPIIVTVTILALAIAVRVESSAGRRGRTGVALSLYRAFSRPNRRWRGSDPSMFIAALPW